MIRVIRRFLADQRVRFLIVGAINTVVGYLMFAALTYWVFAGVPFGYLVSLIVSYACAITLAFILYRRFVFVVSGNVVRDFLRFVSVYALSIAVNALALPFLVEIVGLPPLLAQALILIATTLVSFVGHKYFSFRRKNTAAAVTEGTVPVERAPQSTS